MCTLATVAKGPRHELDLNVTKQKVCVRAWSQSYIYIYVVTVVMC